MSIDIEAEKYLFCDAVRAEYPVRNHQTNEKLLSIFFDDFDGWLMAKRAALTAASAPHVDAGSPVSLATAADTPQQEPVGHIYTMEALAPGSEVKYHAQIYKALPSGTKLYTVSPPPAVRVLSDEDAEHMQAARKALAELRESVELCGLALGRGDGFDEAWTVVQDKEKAAYQWLLADVPRVPARQRALLAKVRP